MDDDHWVCVLEKVWRYVPRTGDVDRLNHGVPTFANQLYFSSVVENYFARVENSVLVCVEHHAIRAGFEHLVPFA